MSDTKIAAQVKHDHALAMHLAREEAKNTKGSIPDRFVPKLQQARAIDLRIEQHRKALASPTWASKASAMFSLKRR